MKIGPFSPALLLAVALSCATPAPAQNAVSPQQPGPQPATPGSPLPAAAPSSASPTKDGIGYLTAEQLATQCADQKPANISYCFAYIAAVHDTMRAYEIWLGEKEFCVPPNVAQGDLRRSFLTYISAYPQNKGGQAASVIAIALKQSYPCILIAPPSQPLPTDPPLPPSEASRR